MVARRRATDQVSTVGLVLGGGGFVGGAWHTGALQALEDVTGWRPQRADYLVGTSAGAMIATLIAGGADAADVPSLFYGPGLEELREDAAQLARPQGAAFRWHGGWPIPTLGSPRLAWEAIRHPGRIPAVMAMAAVLPRGFISTDPIKEMVRRVVPEGWVQGSNLWVIGCDLETGARIAFGSKGAPATSAADAVAASCAIPGFYHPEEIDGRLYVDGGCWSPSNLDMIQDLGLDLVICLNPTSSSASVGRWHQKMRAWGRTVSGRRLSAEARLVREKGTRVALLQPGVEDLVAMGTNYMKVANLDRVTEVARESVAHELRHEHPELVEQLRHRPVAPVEREGVIARTLGRIGGKRSPRRGAQPALSPVVAAVGDGTLQLQ